jgi:hypothetical protein
MLPSGRRANRANSLQQSALPGAAFGRWLEAETPGALWLGDDIPDEKYQDMLDLASHIVESKAGHFEPCGARVSRSLVPCADTLSLA